MPRGGRLDFMHPEMTVAGAPINPCSATADAQSLAWSVSPTGFRTPSGQLLHFETPSSLPKDPYKAVLYPPRGPH